ncbi:MAG: hypothetical protein KDA32_00785 [Phycisphaerales bacterium]|nr:hypothetical protein [Phycisphaerales bacterium]
MRERRDDITEALDRYLDNQMSDDERRAFEESLTGDSAARREVASQRAVDESLKRLFPAPDVERVLERALRSAPSRRRAPVVFRFTAMAAAAALVTAIGVYWFNRAPTQNPVIQNTFRPESFETAYNREVEAGFKPEIVCKDDLEFAGAAWGASREGLLVASATDVKVVGWVHSTAISPKTLMLLTRVDGDTPVAVFFDTGQSAEQYASRLKLPCRGKLHAHRRDIGQAAVIEISPLAEPRVVNLLQPAQYTEEELRAAFAGW